MGLNLGLSYLYISLSSTNIYSTKHYFPYRSLYGLVAYKALQNNVYAQAFSIFVRFILNVPYVLLEFPECDAGEHASNDTRRGRGSRVFLLELENA